jgi:hypothetical protein
MLSVTNLLLASRSPELSMMVVGGERGAKTTRCIASTTYIQTTRGSTPGSESIHRYLADQPFRLASCAAISRISRQHELQCHRHLAEIAACLVTISKGFFVRFVPSSLDERMTGPARVKPVDRYVSVPKY